MVQEQFQRSMSRSSRHTRELARRFSKLTEVQAAVGWGLILLIIALLGVIYLNQSSRVAIVGRRVQTLRGDLIDIQRVNADLEEDIAVTQKVSDGLDQLFAATEEFVLATDASYADILDSQANAQTENNRQYLVFHLVHKRIWPSTRITTSFKCNLNYCR